MAEQSPIRVKEGGSIPPAPLHFCLRGSPSLYIEEISLVIATAFVKQHHYSKVMPKLNKVVLGLFDPTARLVGIITFGWGVRPKDTIRVLFPSLDSQDYLEIGKLCLLDELPKNSESRFITAAIRCLRQMRPDLKVLFTWADAIWGKPGYIYQASNFYCGPSISSEAYRDSKGQRIHPRQLHKLLISIGEITAGKKGRYVTPTEVRENPKLGVGNWAPRNTKSGVRRPFPSDMARLGLSHVRGLQFRYVYFLCNAKIEQRLLAESTVAWRKTDYPKTADCIWTVRNGAENWHNWTPGAEPVFTAAFDTEKTT